MMNGIATENKAEFVRNLLRGNPKSTAAEAIKAWADAGNRGELTPQNFYGVKSQMRKRGERPIRRMKKAASKAAGARSPARPAAPEQYDAVKITSDEILHLLWALGEEATLEDFRRARREITARVVVTTKA